MRRVLYVLAASIVVLAVAWVLAGLPGRVTAEFGATTIEMATPVAVLGLLLLFVVLYAVFRLLGGMLRLPGIAARWDAERDRRRGDLAVGRALLALAAGDKADARREAGRARRWLGDTPQTLLLAAEAGRLAGRDDEAEDAFRRLGDRPDAAFLGYRGLLRQALTRQDWTEAAALARQAEAVHPGAEWLRHQRARLAIRAGRWTEALDLADNVAARAALAAAAADAEQDPGRATKLARQAWKADASLAPAALAYATRLRAEGREARAQAVIRHTWALAPHPDLAAFALAPVADKLARAQAAQRLAEVNPEHAESRLLLARTALDAGLTGEARHQATLARAAGLNQRRLWLLLAEIEEAEHGDTEAGRLAARDALRQAAAADADPDWCCTECHTPHAVWYPACTSCGTAGSLRWMSGRTATYPVPAVLTPLPPAAGEVAA
jgi:HemY protein